MKKIFIFVLTLFSLFCFTKVNAVEMELGAKSAILIDQNTGKVLYNKNENERLAPASMTKIMSLILIMEKIDDGSLRLDDKIEISTEASSMGGSQIFLNPGESYLVKDLIKGVAMASANDVVVTKKQSQVIGEEIII